MKQLFGPMLGALTVLCWSAYNVAAKHGIDTGFSPEALAFLRFAVPGIVALPALAVLQLRGRHPAIPLPRLIVLVMFGGPCFGLFAVSGYEHAPLSHGLLFAPVAVFLAGSVMGHFLLQERISASRLSGAGVMFIGLAVLVGFDMGGLDASWGQGVAFFLLAGVIWGCYTILLRYWRIPTVEGTVLVAAGSAILALPILGGAAYGTLSSASTSSLALQIVMQGVIGGVLSVMALIGAVRALSAQMAALLPIFTPVVALMIACVFLGVVPSAAEVFGVTIIAAGFLWSFDIRWRSLGGLRPLRQS